MVVAFVGIVVPALKRRADWACAAVALATAVITHGWPHQSGLLFSSLLAVATGMALARTRADE
jgi:predicted branched-subunit amino acid permease